MDSCSQSCYKFHDKTPLTFNGTFVSCENLQQDISSAEAPPALSVFTQEMDPFTQQDILQ